MPPARTPSEIIRSSIERAKAQPRRPGIHTGVPVAVTVSMEEAQQILAALDYAGSAETAVNPAVKGDVPLNDADAVRQSVYNALGVKSKAWPATLELLVEMTKAWNDAQGNGAFSVDPAKDRGYAVAAAWRDRYAKLLGALVVPFEVPCRSFKAGLPADHQEIADKIIHLLGMVEELNVKLKQQGYGDEKAGGVFARVLNLVNRNKELSQIAVAAKTEVATTRVPVGALTFEALSIANYARCPAFGHTVEDWSIERWMVAITGEVGELANMIKKILRNDPKLPSQLDLGYEAADIVIYLDLACQKLGIRLGDMVEEKFNAISLKRGSDIRIGAA